MPVKTIEFEPLLEAFIHEEAAAIRNAIWQIVVNKPSYCDPYNAWDSNWTIVNNKLRLDYVKGTQGNNKFIVDLKGLFIACELGNIIFNTKGEFFFRRNNPSDWEYDYLLNRNSYGEEVKLDGYIWYNTLEMLRKCFAIKLGTIRKSTVENVTPQDLT